MPVEIFSQAQFEAALPVHKTTCEPLWILDGYVDGELQYRMPIDASTFIVIRSSIDRYGYSAESGEDSIRAWLVGKDGKPLGSKVSKWTTRLPGWNTRLCDVLRTLWAWRKKAGDCPHCNQPLKIYKVKKAGPNKGRIFAKCDEHNSFTWLED